MSVVIDAAEMGLTGLAYQAGAQVPPGTYRRVDAPGRDVELPVGGRLPASFDGRVALYVKVARFMTQVAV